MSLTHRTLFTPARRLSVTKRLIRQHHCISLLAGHPCQWVKACRVRIQSGCVFDGSVVLWGFQSATARRKSRRHQRW